MNKIIDTTTIPESWKLSKVAPALSQEDNEAAIPPEEDEGGTQQADLTTTSTSTATTPPRPETTTIINAPNSIEILQIYVPAGQSNAVKLIWGHNTDQQFNFTYGIHYGIEEEELSSIANIYPENLLLTMLPKIYLSIRELALPKILKARKESKCSRLRELKLPQLNTEALHFYELIHWATEKCHTQAVERCVKLVITSILNLQSRFVNRKQEMVSSEQELKSENNYQILIPNVNAKNTTNELNALIDNLEYCTMYHFAISANSENKINHNDIRSIVTEINRENPPVDFQVDFQPGEQPCLLIRWSSSCANYMEPISYNDRNHCSDCRDLGLHPYRIQLTQELNPNDHLFRRRFAKRWIASYLANRKQIVEITKNNCKYLSNAVDVKIGIPQADDTNLVVASKNVNSVTSKSNRFIRQDRDWFTKNRLILNEQKTNCILFKTKMFSIITPVNVNLNNNVLNISANTKFLGLYIDENLDWCKHIQELNKKLNSVHLNLDLNVIKTVYFAYFQSVLRFGIIFWGQCKDIQAIFVAQKNCLRTMLGFKYGESLRGQFKKHKILTVTAVYVFKILMFIDLRLNSERTRALKYPRLRLTIFEKGCFYACIVMYNKLPSYIQSVSKLPVLRALPWNI
ncbi:unnamed protein product [Brassicogethes aeneus]|uniref:Uncharacterized protein n=1 Tax=Brassicogethes aeneus TaxID=1431903 RepID=A0A9P0FCH8_BRAAE|nr:unnamed protein product [Brassicogethes aeneus]